MNAKKTAFVQITLAPDDWRLLGTYLREVGGLPVDATDAQAAGFAAGFLLTQFAREVEREIQIGLPR